ncbi:MAG: hypothetical protein AAFR88_12860, partial [Pseudomonadota bacterium]
LHASAHRLACVEAAGEAYGCPTAEWSGDTTLADLLDEAGLTTTALGYMPTGWTRDALYPELAAMIDNHRAHLILSDLERATWPYAKAGFFGVKKQIDNVLRELGMTGTPLAAAS